MAPTIVITGANRGIGFELAKQLSKSAIIIGTARNPSNASQLKSLENVHVVGMDITSEESIKSALDEITKLAPNGIDELWNNAGRDSTRGYVTEPIDIQEWIAEYQTNVIGQTLVTRHLLPLLRKGQGKKIIFVSSAAASVSEIKGSGPQVVYSSSKAALDVTVKYWYTTLSQEGFVVTPLNPGWTITDMGGPNAHLQPEESVSGMLKVVKDLTPTSPIELRQYNGISHAW